MRRPTPDGRLATREGLKRLRGRPGVPPEYLDFRLRVHELQWVVWDELVARGALAASRPASASGAVTAADLALDDGLLLGTLEALGVVLPDRLEPQVGARALLEAARPSPGLLRELAVTAAFAPVEAAVEEHAGRIGCSTDALLFFGRVLAAPFVTAAVCRPGPTDGAEAGERSLRCPACGATPGLAVLAGERGARTLCCSLCGTSWPAARAQCPFCGGTTALGLIEEPGERVRRLETCDDCRYYILTVDARSPGREGPVLPLVEVVEGLYLDLIAETHGCRRGLPYAALV
ncbi:MAG: formate dehydrogenase accessory protein FdhE [Deltaproteobacteria bacterium]|nr:formate dehydrogenase accessory protein FdhE [Deltaproteobacteria bacterium]